MKKSFLILIIAVITVFSDTVYMKNGSVLNGNIVTQNKQSVIIFSNGANYTLNRTDIAQVQVDTPQQQTQQAPAQQYPQQQQAQPNYQQYPNQPYQQGNQYGGYQRPPVNRKGVVLTAVGGSLLAFGVIGIPIGLGKTIKFASFDKSEKWQGMYYFWNTDDNEEDSSEYKHPGLELLISSGVCATAGSILLSKGVKQLKASRQGQPYARLIPDNVYLGINEENYVNNRRYSAHLSWAAF